MASQYDLTIIGGGILGLATALKITAAHPSIRLLLLEKEAQLARHQTGNNSGVIHSGLYYRPGSLKARSCVSGRKELIAFCDANDIPYEICGKVVVATSEVELPRLEELHRRGVANGLKGMEIIGPERLKEIEPHATRHQRRSTCLRPASSTTAKSPRPTPTRCATPTATFACRKESSAFSIAAKKSSCKPPAATIERNI